MQCTIRNGLIHKLWALCLGLATCSQAVQSSELLSLLQVLRENGTITQAQYQRLETEALQGRKMPSAQPRPSNTPIKTAATDDRRRPEATAGVKTKFGKNGGLSWKDPERDLELSIGGRLLLDAASYQDDQETMGNGTELRAARLTIKGALAEDWHFKAQYDFAENDLNVKDVYLRYTGFGRPDGITLGHFKEPFSLEDQTSSKHISFMERALPVDVFSPGRALGLGLDEHGKSWSLSGGVFANSVGDVPANEGNEGWGLAARGTLALLKAPGRILHLGLAGEYREPDTERELRYRTGAESHLSSVNLVNTGKISSVDYHTTLGLEAALVQGPYSIQGEYIQSRVTRLDANPALSFDGWYLYGSWMITGESRPYSSADGAFDRLVPRHPHGAWELALRYSSLDLNDEDILGGTMDSVTLGLNWYLNPRVRFMANYIRVNSEREGLSDNPNIFQLRGQLVF